jgi:hypothetical protein
MATPAERAEVDELEEETEGDEPGAATSAAFESKVPADVKRGTRADALDLIFETAVRDGEGFRHGALGAPRYGKTYHLVEVASEALTRGISDLLLIHDCKRLDVQYDEFGAEVVRVDKADLQSRPLAEEDPPVVVFHGAPAEGRKCSVEEVAALGLEQGRAGTPTLVLVDELYHGMKARQTWAGPSFAECLREGSSQRVSTAWTTQIPQSLPTEAMDLTETIAVFRLKRRSLRYARKMLELDADEEGARTVEIISALGRGEFILITDDGWNGVVYGPK